jgi:hypothetical protein
LVVSNPPQGFVQLGVWPAPHTWQAAQLMGVTLPAGDASKLSPATDHAAAARPAHPL